MIKIKTNSSKQSKLIIRVLVVIIILLMYVAGYYHSISMLNEKKLDLIRAMNSPECNLSIFFND